MIHDTLLTVIMPIAQASDIRYWLRMSVIRRAVGTTVRGCEYTQVPSEL
jgi:hypothetical protein